MPDTLGDVRREAQDAARRSGVSPRDVDLLLGDLVGRDTAYVIAHDDRVLTDEERERFDAALRRRLDGEPVQYIRGHCEFYGRTFEVDRRVLIPRPETELICEQALARALPDMRIIDVGTGSGAIAITLSLENPELHVFATDFSIDALVVTRRNAQRLGASLCLAADDVLASYRGTFSMIVSNPPYVSEEDLPGLQREVALHEPHLALSGGSGGMEVIRRLVADAERVLAPDGVLIVEIGFDQRERLTALAQAANWDVKIIPDLAGFPRCGVLRRRAQPSRR